MLELSTLGGATLYENAHTNVLTSYSYDRNVVRVLDQGDTDMCCVYSIAGLVELMLNMRGELGFGNTMNTIDLFSRRADHTVAGMSFREAFDLMIDTGYKVGSACLFARGYFRIPGAELLKRYIIAYGPVLMALPVYSPDSVDFWVPHGALRGYHGIMAVGYNAQGVELVNSYGSTWGRRGRAVLPWEDFSCVKELWGLLV